MENKKKCFFGTKMSIEVLSKYLQEKGILNTCMIDSPDMLYSTIYVDAENYHNALQVGTDMSLKRNLPVAWIDYYDRYIVLGYIPVMQLVLPDTRSYNLRSKKDDIIDYSEKLKEYCGRKVDFQYSEATHSFNVFVEAPFGVHDLVVRQCKGFNYTNPTTPFIETYYTEKDNRLEIDTLKREEDKNEALKSYFNNSLFYDMLWHPMGSNIAPHNDDYDFVMGNYDGECRINTSSFEKKPNNIVIISGNFEVVDRKGLGQLSMHYGDCVVTDSGKYASKLKFTPDEVTIKTKIKVERSIVGRDLDGQNLRDNFFRCLSTDGTKGTTTYTEHFVKIANGKRLLHYSDEYEPFEIFELPDNFFIEDGLSIKSTGYPKVFDDYEFDTDDKDLEEALFIMLTSKMKKNDKQKTIGKKDGE